MGIACWITKATDTNSEYVILIAFPQQQESRKRAPVVRCTCISCLVLPDIEKDTHSATGTYMVFGLEIRVNVLTKKTH
jgi:hypothetical protein